ncbi:MAG: glycosyl hydrolase family 28 protein [Bacteroidia bacterium]
MVFNIQSVGIACMFLMLAPSFLFAHDYNILNFGAVGDGKTLNTTFIQAAVDEAHQNGGGRVIIPAGSFVSGSIVLKSGVELYLHKKASLLGSLNPADYFKLNRWVSLILADSAERIGIGGNGIIDGRGHRLALRIDSLFYAGKIDSADYTFPEMRPRVYLRPQIIEFVKCRHVSVSGVTIRHCASWVQSYAMCEDVVIDHIRVDSDTYWNNDGVDIIDCKKVRITNSFFNTSDDGICLKSYPDEYHHVSGIIPICDSIYIANCTVRSSASAVKFGTASYGGFRNVTIENIKVYDTYRSAIALECYQGGTLEKVLIQNIEAKNTGNAIFIRAGKKTNRLNTRPGTISDVIIRNVKAEIAFERPDLEYEIRGPALPFFHNVFPSSIVGLPESKVHSIRLENIDIRFPGRGNNAFANLPLDRLDQIPELPDAYPEFSMFGELPAWGFYIRHVSGLSMSNVRVKIRRPDYRPAFVLDDVKNASLESVDIIGDKKPVPFFLHNTEQILLKE